jgi:hypothetical protein
MDEPLSQIASHRYVLTLVANLRLFSVSFVWAARGDRLQNMSVLLEPITQRVRFSLRARCLSQAYQKASFAAGM